MYRIKGPIQTVRPDVKLPSYARVTGQSPRDRCQTRRSSGPGAGGARTGAAASRGGAVMRVMAKITIPAESGSLAVKDGSIGGLIQSAAERWKPEAMYFGTFDGHRTAFMVFDMPDSSDMVPFGEPFFMALDADVEIG